MSRTKIVIIIIIVIVIIYLWYQSKQTTTTEGESAIGSLINSVTGNITEAAAGSSPMSYLTGTTLEKYKGCLNTAAWVLLTGGNGWKDSANDNYKDSSISLPFAVYKEVVYANLSNSEQTIMATLMALPEVDVLKDFESVYNIKSAAYPYL